VTRTTNLSVAPRSDLRRGHLMCRAGMARRHERRARLARARTQRHSWHQGTRRAPSRQVTPRHGGYRGVQIRGSAPTGSGVEGAGDGQWVWRGMGSTAQCSRYYAALGWLMEQWDSCFRAFPVFTCTLCGSMRLHDARRPATTRHEAHRP
jgi:hypothetical protein